MEFPGQFGNPFESSSKTDKGGSKGEKSTGNQAAGSERQSAPGNRPAAEGVIPLHARRLEALAPLSRAPLLEQFVEEKTREARHGENRTEQSRTDRPNVLPAPAAAPVSEAPIPFPPLRPEATAHHAPPIEFTEQKHDDEAAADDTAAAPSYKPPVPIPPRPQPRAEQPARLAEDDFSSLMQQMSQEFAAQASGGQLGEQAPADVFSAEAPPPGPSPEPERFTPNSPLPPGPPIARPAESYPFAPPPPTPAAGGGGRPPFGPPPGPPLEFGGFNQPPDPNQPMPAANGGPFNQLWPRAEAPAGTVSESSAAYSPAILAERPNPLATSQAEYAAEKRGLRRGLVAGFITGYVLKQFLANRKMRRFEQATATQFNQRDKQIDYLQREQYAAAAKLAEQKQQIERLAAQRQPAVQPPAPRFEQPLQQAGTQVPFERLPAAAPPLRAETPFAQSVPGIETVPPPGVSLEQQQAQELVAQAYELQPNQRIEHSSWHNIIVDEHGREVQGAISYGEAFQQERQQEQVRPAAFGSDGGQASGGSGSAAGGGGAGGGSAAPSYTPVDGSANPLLYSGQASPAHQLSVGQPGPVDLRHRLPATPQQKVANAMSNPWLWVGVAIILLAFFATALL